MNPRLNCYFLEEACYFKGLEVGGPMYPLLFVLVMEYLHRILQGLKDEPNFNFHPKCERLNITNIWFADDLLLFIRGDIVSVWMMMTKFIIFSESTELKASPTKCRMFFGNVDTTKHDLIVNETGFGIGTMSVQYLGLPLIHKKLLWSCVSR